MVSSNLMDTCPSTRTNGIPPSFVSHQELHSLYLLLSICLLMYGGFGRDSQ